MSNVSAGNVSAAIERLWNIDFIKIFILQLVYNICMQMIGSTLPYYVMVLGGSSSEAGVMVGIMTVVALASRPFVGFTLDTKGRRPVMLLGILIFMTAVAVFLFCPVVIVIIIFRIIQGLGIACTTTANGTIAADVLPMSRLTEGIAYFGLANSLATAIGPAIALSLVSGSNYTPMFLTSLGAGACALCIGLSMNYEKKGGPKKTAVEATNKLFAENKPENEKFIWRFFERTAVAPAIVVAVMTIGIAAVVSFLPAYAINQGIANPGIFYTVTAITMLIVRVATGKLLGKLHTLALIVPSLAIFSIGLLVLSYFTSLPRFLIGAVVYGIGMGSAMPILSALVISNAPVNKRGAANATYLSAFDLGIGLGSTIWGVVIDFFGYQPAFIGGAGFGLLAMVMSIFLLRHRKLA